MRRRGWWTQGLLAALAASAGMTLTAVGPAATAGAQPAGVAQVDVKHVFGQLEAELGDLLGRGKPVGYRYTNAQGQQVQVGGLQEVPEPLRAAAEPVYDQGGQGQAVPGRPAGPKEIYKYRDANGREVYTNIVEQIPVEEREEALMDLSHIPLNSELGGQISDRLGAAHAALSKSEYCTEAQEDGKMHVLKQAWKDYAPLIICAALLLAFFIASPVMIRRVGGPAWSRVLMFAIPALSMAGFMMWSMRNSNEAVVEFRRALTAQDACKKDTFEGLSEQSGGLAKQFDLLRTLQTQMQTHMSAADKIHGPRQ